MPVSGWLTSCPTGVVLSKRSVVTKEIQHATYQYRVITRTQSVTVTEYRAMTQAAAEATAAQSGWNDQTIDAFGFVSASSVAEVARMNEAGAYKVTRTQMTASATDSGWINNPAP